MNGCLAFPALAYAISFFLIGELFVALVSLLLTISCRWRNGAVVPQRRNRAPMGVSESTAHLPKDPHARAGLRGFLFQALCFCGFGVRDTYVFKIIKSFILLFLQADIQRYQFTRLLRKSPFIPVSYISWAWWGRVDGWT